MSARSIGARLIRLGQLGKSRRALLFEAVGWLLLARLSLLLVSFPRLARRLGTVVTPADPRAQHAASVSSPEAASLAAEIGWAVTRAARHAPFKAVCLPQAMAARLMLRRRGVDSVLHFGAKIGDAKPIDAHAWLDAAGVKVTGYPVADAFTEIACFV
jgi:hypothetical protein